MSPNILYKQDCGGSPTSGMHNGGEKGFLSSLSYRVLSHSLYPVQKFYTYPYTVLSVIQSAGLATLLSMTSQRTSQPTCFSKNMALDASAINHIFKNFPTLPYFLVQVVERMLQVSCPSCSLQSFWTAQPCCMKL